ncbi:MAG TPA: APC family permease [Ktedonobacteraceae bacterium]|nr:APC family permease [Ktedonobacteraceae bacterium]
MSIEASARSPQEESLRANTIGLPGVLFQSITTMAPASAVAFSLFAALAYTGGALPLAVIIALVVCVLVALNIGALARYLPSAGGYFTYVSHGLGPQAGWMTGWLFSLAYLLIVPFQLLVLGPVADQFATTYLHLSMGANGWIIWAVIFTLAIFLLTYFGIKISANAGVILGCIEIGVFVLLSVWLIFAPGSQNTGAAFNPASSAQAGLGGWQGVFVGMLFVFTAFAGFESSAPLAEESLNPRRTVPRAILLSTVLIGLFYILCSYAGIAGWNIGKLSSFLQDPDPWATMAGRVWGALSFIVILTILNSALANSNAGVNAITRTLYAMGRTRILPPFLAHLNRHKVPDIALFIALAVAIGAALWAGLALGPFPGGFTFIGTILTFPILIVYVATCASVFFFYWREHREEFNILRHVLVPLIPIVVLGFVIYFQFTSLTPPYNQAIFIVVGWFVLGLIVVVLLSLFAPKELAQANRVYADEEAEA